MILSRRRNIDAREEKFISVLDMKSLPTMRLDLFLNYLEGKGTNIGKDVKNCKRMPKLLACPSKILGKGKVRYQ